MPKTAQIVGVGLGLGLSIAQFFANVGYDVILSSRSTGNSTMLCREIDGTSVACDASNDGEVATLFEKVDEACRSPFVVVYYARTYSRRPVAEPDLDVARATLSDSVWGALLVAQQAEGRMLTQGYGTMLFTGASAGSKGYGRSAPFAMGKFALRGLCQSLARELSPQNIRVVHIDNDGVILEAERGAP